MGTLKDAVVVITGAGRGIGRAIAEELGLSNVMSDAMGPSTHSGKVGDIAFFTRDGKYQWVRNAFHTEVTHVIYRVNR